MNGWNNDNISGLEKRIATLSGIKNPGTRDLCNFELFQYKNVEKPGVVYRVSKKNQPLAFSPCHCFKEEQQEDVGKVLEQLCQKAKEGYDFLEICLAGDITCTMKDPETGLNVFHYIIRDKNTGTVYLISYQHFGTEAEAITAFKENYLHLIQIASDVANYGTLIATHPPTPSPDRPCEANQLPLVYVPKDIKTAYTPKH